MKVKSLIIRPIDPAHDLEAQADSLIPDAFTAMQEIADVDLGSVTLDVVGDTATVNLGTRTEPDMLCLWQHNLIGAIFVAHGVPARPTQRIDPVVHIDDDTRSYSISAVVKPNGAW